MKITIKSCTPHYGYYAEVEYYRNVTGTPYRVKSEFFPCFDRGVYEGGDLQQAIQALADGLKKLATDPCIVLPQNSAKVSNT